MQIKVENLNFVYGKGTAFEQYALKNVSFQVEQGEFLGIIGHTGSGKSTLIQHLNGLIRATEGKIYFQDQDIYAKDFEMKKLRQKVGLVFQYPEHQLFEADVLSDVSFGPKNQGLSAQEVRERAQESLELVGIPKEMYTKSPFEISGGQKRRVAIAGVLAMHPQVLILDEPTAGLDPKGRDEIFEQILKLRKNLQMTVILVSHSMEDVAKYVDRLLVMNAGELVLDGTPKEVFREHDYLESIGLSVPQITNLVELLKQRGIDLGKDITTVQEAKEAILRRIRKGRGND